MLIPPSKAAELQTEKCAEKFQSLNLTHVHPRVGEGRRGNFKDWRGKYEPFVGQLMNICG